MSASGQVTDEALLEAYAAGDARAASVLTARVLPRVYRHASRVLGDRVEAEDVAQEAMVKLWHLAPTWQPGQAQVTTWLYRVTANLCIDRLRRRGGVGLDEIPEPRDPQPSAHDRMLRQARHDALQKALDRLPERQRQAVVLRHIEGLANPEIAEVLDISPRAVESLTARGKRALASALEGQRAEIGFEDDTG
ncbi:MAG: RNA polymerase sigma factor [Pseudomonadota bacterium]